MDIIGVQLDTVWHDKPANHAKVLSLLSSAAISPGALVVLPEMFATGFSMAVAEVADDASHESERFLRDLAREKSICLIGGRVICGSEGKGRNEAMAAFPDDWPSVCYQKIHPFTFGEESNHYLGGKEIVLLRWQGFTIAPFVCYDLRFPEIFRAATVRGANVLVVIANWPLPREEHWLALLRARAIENQCYVVGVNRCGNDPRLAYGGRSQIISPRGHIIADAGAEEGIVRGSIELQPLLDYRREFPVLQDVHREFLGSGDSASERRIS